MNYSTHHTRKRLPKANAQAVYFIDRVNYDYITYALSLLSP